MGDRSYIDIPGTRMHELPPLLVHPGARADWARVVQRAVRIVEGEEMLPEAAADALERRKLELAITLAEQYRALVSHWQWGDSILEWIRQCEITFESEATLRQLLHPDVWPHASRSSFVTLLIEKSVPPPEVAVEQAVGLRLTFRHPPPIDFFSNQFLFYLNSTVAGTAYRTWAQMGSATAGRFPPHRFHFEVVRM
ncbi:MAG: hypothetical protein ACE15B_03075 [Bryobacteraceae bacterium]